MRELVISVRNSLSRFLYKTVFKTVAFRLDPERVHDGITHLGVSLGSCAVGRKLTSFAFSYTNPSLRQNILGIHFPNPIGLAAGFDKNAQLTDIIPSVGFGFEEVGSITGEPCPGNEGKRLWRLKKSKGLVVYYGLKNDGCIKISERLSRKKFKIPIGISVAKTNSKDTVDTEKGIEDYVKAYSAFSSIGDYYTINISCPNAYGGEPFTDAKKLDLLLKRLGSVRHTKPIFLKLSPDISESNIDEIIDVAGRYSVNGFICTNLSKIREGKNIIDKDIPSRGGLSGKIVEDVSNRSIQYVYKKTKGKFVIIGCGGVFSAADAYKKIKLGASLIQLISGMVFEGPQLICEINKGLAGLLKKDGFGNISEAVGTDN